jgi:hypothetical protein
MTIKHKTRAVIFAGVLSAMATVAPVSGIAQVSLATVVDLAERNSAAVRIDQAELRKAQAALDESTDAYIPTLSIGSTVGPPTIGFPTGQPSIANASMQSLVLSFPQKQYIRAAREGIQAATLNLKDVREQVALDASTAYIELDTVNREMEAAHPMPLKTLFLNPPSFENYDGGASSRWPATREIESYWYPVWLAYPAGMLEGSRLLDAPPHQVDAQRPSRSARSMNSWCCSHRLVDFKGDQRLPR